MKRWFERLVQVLQGIRRDDRDRNFGWDASRVEVDAPSGEGRWAVGRNCPRQAKNWYRAPRAGNGLLLLLVDLDFGSVCLLGGDNVA
jgi:hypothetical protein